MNNLKIKNHFTIQVNDDEPITAYNTLLARFYKDLWDGEIMGLSVAFYEDSSQPTPLETPLSYDYKKSISSNLNDNELYYDFSVGAYCSEGTCTLNLSDAVGVNIKSIGLLDDSNCPICRAILTDQNGNNISILKTDLDKITITYTIYVTFETDQEHFYFCNKKPNVSLRSLLCGVPSILTRHNTTSFAYDVERSYQEEPLFGDITVRCRIPDDASNYAQFKAGFAVGDAFVRRYDLDDSGYRIENEILSFDTEHGKVATQKYFGCFNETITKNGEPLSQSDYTIEPYTHYAYLSASASGSSTNSYIQTNDGDVYVPLGPHVYIDDVYTTRTSSYSIAGNPIAISGCGISGNGITFNASSWFSYECVYGCIQVMNTDDYIVLRNDQSQPITAFAMEQYEYSDANMSVNIPVYGSNDGNSWTLITTVTSLPRTNTMFSVNKYYIFLVDQNYKYIKILSQNTNTIMMSFMPLTTPQNIDGVAGSIILNDPVTDDDVVSISYNCRCIPKSIDNVIDFEFNLHVGE